MRIHCGARASPAENVKIADEQYDHQSSHRKKYAIRGWLVGTTSKMPPISSRPTSRKHPWIYPLRWCRQW
jgi:hypothetical protein